MSVALPAVPARLVAEQVCSLHPASGLNVFTVANAAALAGTFRPATAFSETFPKSTRSSMTGKPPPPRSSRECTTDPKRPFVGPAQEAPPDARWRDHVSSAHRRSFRSLLKVKFQRSRLHSTCGRAYPCGRHADRCRFAWSHGRCGRAGVGIRCAEVLISRGQVHTSPTSDPSWPPPARLSSKVVWGTGEL